MPKHSHCAKIIELVGCGKTIEGAVQNALKRAGKNIRGITGLKVVSINATVDKNKVVEYRANVKIAFGVED